MLWAVFLEDDRAKKQELDYLMEKYAGQQNFTYKAEALAKVIVIRVEIEKVTGKKSGYR